MIKRSSEQVRRAYAIVDGGDGGQTWMCWSSMAGGVRGASLDIEEESERVEPAVTGVIGDVAVGEAVGVG
jgi:hypothetical protein